ncbi:AraC family transcriptional regulator [Ketobacter sp. MCCC 1A13808]|uniref:helix-turn-helix domain-containing protein n=1 Tax=Ketobacter sp. MCCC 1A13808 TaxID=2602738 RepID=UPI000F21E6A7|nr:AraC family transcriptional regulator [Ketobacter sp. MCCC 1A13808]MVF11079.1 AraC family transcriptional regulator [Ketobacter sp. MCCC 1A13808]RLP56458.1 MAG: AraC family transcriptional regulator [Ketobacter sp.]
MNSNDPHLPSSFLDPLICYLDIRGLDAPALRADIAALSQDPRINTTAFTDLLNRIYQLEPVPALGMRIAAVTKPEHFGVVGYLLTSCSTLGQALIRYGRFQALVFTGLNAVVRKSRNAVSHRWNLSDQGTHLSCEYSVAIFVNLYQSLIGKKIPPVSVGVPISKNKDYKIYEALLGCPVEFDCSCLRVDIPAQAMLMTISSSDAYLLKLFDEQAQSMLGQTKATSDSFDQFLKQLQQQLLIAMKDGDTSANTVASQMGFALRTFYRNLSNHGYSYRSVLANSRRQLAKRYLADPALSPSEVALLLGYSEQSAFIRAFKGWMGMTPGEYRRTLTRNT